MNPASSITTASIDLSDYFFTGPTFHWPNIAVSLAEWPMPEWTIHYGDTLHHIIGLGRKTYEEDLADVSVVSLWYHGQREPKVRASFQYILLQPGDPDDKEDFDSIVAKESDCIVAVKYGEA
jgi:hypothetical protein